MRPSFQIVLPELPCNRGIFQNVSSYNDEIQRYCFPYYNKAFNNHFKQCCRYFRVITGCFENIPLCNHLNLLVFSPHVLRWMVDLFQVSKLKFWVVFSNAVLTFKIRLTYSECNVSIRHQGWNIFSSWKIAVFSEVMTNFSTVHTTKIIIW